jgi:hypothetical protein
MRAALRASLALSIAAAPIAHAEPPSALSLRLNDLSKLFETGERTVRLPCGVYTVSETIKLPSNANLGGSGPCTILKASPSLKPNADWSDFARPPYPVNLIANANWRDGNSNIRLHDLTLDGAGVRGNAHLATFYKSSGVLVERVRFLGDGTIKVQDGVSFVASSDYRVLRNYCFNIANACFDQWRGSRNFIIDNNEVDGNWVTDYPILVNGLSGDAPEMATHDGIVSRNRIRNAKSFGITVTGLYNAEETFRGVVRQISIERNFIKGVRDFYGIRVGDGSLVRISRNSISDIGRDCIRIGAQKGHLSSTSFVLASNNTCSGANVKRTADVDAISVVNGADNTVLIDNSVSGSAQRYSVLVDSSVRATKIVPGKMDAGRVGMMSPLPPGTLVYGRRGDSAAP